VWNQFTVMVENRDRARKRLEEKGIPTDIFYPKTTPAQPVFAKHGWNDAAWPIAAECARRALSLPIFPELTDQEQAQVITALGEVL